MAENNVSKTKKLFTVCGLVVLALGIILYFAKAPMGLNRKIYDLPIFLIIIGFIARAL